MQPNTDNPTAPPAPRSPSSPPPAADVVHALVLVWSRHEPHRVGEVALLADAHAWLIGRGTDDGAHPRIELTRARPNAAPVPTSHLRGDQLSRHQMRVIFRGDDAFEVLNQGPVPIVVDGVHTTRAPLPLIVNGVSTERALLRVGDIFGPDDHYLFLLTTRPRKLTPTDYPPPAFGAVDAHGILGESAAAWKLRAEIALAAKSPRPALLFGESGTGKELAANAIHSLSRRARGPYVTRNAATLPEGVLEAELFGNMKGFPNPGMAERPGLVGEADGGTLLFDEIGELPENLQSRLLRFLDNGEYHRLGDAKVRRADVRVIGATNRDVSAMKHDVAARMTTRITLPPLAARREDIPLLVRNLVLKHATDTPEIAQRFVRREEDGSYAVRVEADVITTLVRREYTTNVRELDRLIWDAICATTDGDTIRMTDELRAPQTPTRTPGLRKATAHVGDPNAPSAEVLLEGYGRYPSEAVVRESLIRHRGVVAKCARELGIDRTALYRLLRKYGIQVREADERADERVDPAKPHVGF